ncbi:hypothetical protein M514_02037 [Trichuris suis]|uniref:Uncharacterized protein n=1 Tax=Trichuris suis TaxID=68888 RepID=A0A085N2A1_9BILA|nr:hypothetical protein M513_02037 [Trichuris suis]KFD63597.1 hypothetical protein M514_02037 [Trichuris suis]KHJ44450.1 hypothetical protein D918_05461 [Trichuris suis]
MLFQLLFCYLAICGTSLVIDSDRKKPKLQRKLDDEELHTIDQQWLADGQKEQKDKLHSGLIAKNIEGQVRCGRSKDTPCYSGADRDSTEPKKRYKRGFGRWLKKTWSKVKRGASKAWSHVRKVLPKHPVPIITIRRTF